MFKRLFDELWNRVFVHWKPTLIGLVLAVGVQVLDVTTGFVSANIPPPWGGIISAMLAIAGAFLKSRPQSLPVPPADPT